MSSLYLRQEAINLNTDISVLVVGAGGIGFHFAKYAAMSGVREIHIFDDDTLEEHNLNRLDVPTSALGKNKADIARLTINQLRPDCMVFSKPFRLQDYMIPEGVDWLVDCTDSFTSQEANEEMAHQRGIKYLKLGYDGTHITISHSVAKWGEDDEDDGYNIVPSWVVPAVTVAALGVGVVIKYSNKETSADISDFYR